MSRLSVLITWISLARHVMPHEHHGEDIPDGEAVSAEPIVCLIPPPVQDPQRT